MNVEEILEALKQEKQERGEYVEPVAEKTIEELGSFQFSTDKDDQGIRIQNPAFVKKNCKNCYGRGGVIQSMGGRHWQVCGCVIKGYVKARRAHDEALAKTKRIAEAMKRNDEAIAKIDEIIAMRQAQMEAAK